MPFSRSSSPKQKSSQACFGHHCSLCTCPGILRLRCHVPKVLSNNTGNLSIVRPEENPVITNFTSHDACHFEVPKTSYHHLARSHYCLRFWYSGNGICCHLKTTALSSVSNTFRVPPKHAFVVFVTRSLSSHSLWSPLCSQSPFLVLPQSSFAARSRYCQS